MKTYITTIFVSFLFITACNISKKAAVKVFNPAGSWDYTINETPMGDVTGVLVLKQGENGWAGSLNSPQGSLDLSNVNLEDRSLTATFDFDGAPLQLDVKFETDSMLKGMILSEMGSFPMAANKKIN